MPGTAKGVVEKYLPGFWEFLLNLYEKWAFKRVKKEFVYSREDGVYWRTNGGGPYCPTCLDADHKDVLLTQGATRGVYSCPLHGTTHWRRGTRERIRRVLMFRRRFNRIPR